MGELPDDCTGIKQIDPELPFCKENCQWVYRTVGRPPKAKDRAKYKNRCKKVQNPISICLVLEKNHLEFIRQQALHRSVKEGVYIEANDLIREALTIAFPLPTQYDMFGGKK